MVDTYDEGLCNLCSKQNQWRSEGGAGGAGRTGRHLLGAANGRKL